MDRKVEKKFWEGVRFLGAAPDECWIWGRGKSGNGYGELMQDGLKLLAHRVSAEIHFGENPGLDVLHSCDVKLCCNPAHLRYGNPSENMRDKLERHGGKTLTVQMVKTIRAMAKSGVKHYPLAKMFGISYPYLWRILTWQSWPTVDY